jgi:hypothetical protein
MEAAEHGGAGAGDVDFVKVARHELHRYQRLRDVHTIAGLIFGAAGALVVWFAGGSTFSALGIDRAKFLARALVIVFISGVITGVAGLVIIQLGAAFGLRSEAEREARRLEREHERERDRPTARDDESA